MQMSYEHPEQQSRPQGPHHLMSLSAILPLKLSTSAQIVLVHDQTQQFQLLSNLVWRQNTGMPVVRVLGFRNQSSTFPKTYSVEVEYMDRCVKQLEDVELSDSLYIIRQSLLGLQALYYKYRQYDLHKVFFGLNEYGECKVWISDHLTEYKSVELPLPKEDIIISHVLRMVYWITNNAGKMDLSELMNEVAKATNIGFSQFYDKINQFAHRKRVFISNFARVERKLTLFSNAKSQIVKRTTSLEKKPSPFKVNFRYESPLPRNLHMKRENQWQMRQRLSLCRSLKSKITCPERNYEDNNKTTLQSIAKAHETSINDIKLLNEKPKSIESMLSSPNKLKQKLKHSKDTTKPFSIKTISIKNVLGSAISNEKENKSQMTCTSLTMNENFSSEKSGDMKSGSQCGKGKGVQRSSLILSNTNLSQDYSVQVKQALKNDHEGEAKEEKANLGSGNYNFGGLLPLMPMPERSIKQSQQIDESLLEHYEHHDFAAQIKRRNQRSLVLSHEDVAPVAHIWDWQNKMFKLLTEDTGNLKQSVYCGEEKKPEPLQIKLEKLGKLGREITSMIPQSHQH